jgi:hypothetical protein
VPADARALIPGMDESAFRLVQACAEKVGGLANLPYVAIVQALVAYRIRRRRPEP